MREKTDLTVTLTEDTQLLGNVVVVGYGTQKKRRFDFCHCYPESEGSFKNLREVLPMHYKEVLPV